MLASKDTLYAVLRIEARTQEAEQELAVWRETSFLDRERNGALLVLAQNNTGEGHEREWKNGGMGMDILEVDDGTAYVLLTNNGGEFAPGDLILFDMSYQMCIRDRLYAGRGHGTPGRGYAPLRPDEACGP